MFKRSFRDEFSLFFSIPAMVFLAVVGIVLLPILGPFFGWENPRNKKPKNNRES